MSCINGCDMAPGDPAQPKNVVPTEVQSGNTSNTMNWLV